MTSNYTKILQDNQSLEQGERKAQLESELMEILNKKEVLENDFYSPQNEAYYEELETRELQIERELRLIEKQLQIQL